MVSWYSRIHRRFGRFARAQKGNVAITFAFAALPIVAFVGAAVDFSRANAVKAAMQAALDSTALMVAKDAPTLSSTDLQSKALTYFKALFNRSEANNISITATYTTTGGSAVLVNGSAQVPTAFLGVLGHDYITVGGSATTKWGSSRLRVALALDVTGSMASAGKMTALKSATKNLLAQLKAAASQNGDVYVSIIPFNKDVNVGASNYSANWIDWTDWDDDNGYDTQVKTCTTTKVGKNGKSKKKCSTSTTWVPDNHNTWNGCVTDRDMDYDQTVTPPNPADAALPLGLPSTLFPAEQYGSCPVEMMGLNYNWTAMNSLVDAMQPKGMTNQPIGLVWAWQSLVGGGPLTAPAKEPNYEYQEIIILMSDGLNTQDRWYHTQTPIDNRMVQTGNGSGTCANIKAAGITVYTIHVNTDGDPMSTLLQNCASSSDKFWMITSANELGTVFTTIGTNLTQLRVAK